MDIITIFEDDLSLQFFTQNYKIIFTKKNAGNFSFQQSNVPIDKTSSDRLKFALKYNIDLNYVHNPILQHDKNFFIASKPLNISFTDINSQIGEGDAILVEKPGIWGMITFADCIPLALYNIDKPLIASIHLGSRSIIKNVITYLIENWSKIYDLSFESWRAIIGPSIFAENYEIQDDFISLIEHNNKSLINYIKKIDNKYFFDNRGSLIYQLNNLKIFDIIKLDFNTYTDLRFSSYRKEKPNHITQALFVTICR